jgi:hypothetical protein
MATAIAAWLNVALKNMSHIVKYVDQTKYVVKCTRRATGQRDFKKRSFVMKVDFPEELKRQICIADEPIVNKVLGFVAGSDKASTRAEKAARLIGGQHNRLENPKIISANATLSFNEQVNDGYFQGSGHLDIRIDFIAQYNHAICIGTAYLTDIDEVCTDDEENTKLYKKMSIRWFEEQDRNT